MSSNHLRKLSFWATWFFLLSFLVVPAKAATPSVDGGGTFNYSIGDPALSIGSGITITGGSAYDGQYIEFSISSSASSDILSFTKVATPSTTSGEISIVGTTAYVGTGSVAKQIGTIDITNDGTAGKPLRVNLAEGFTNSGFELGDTNSWTIVGSGNEDNFINLGATPLGGFPSVDNSDYSATYNVNAQGFLDGSGTSRTQTSRGNDNTKPQSATFTGMVQSSVKNEGTYALKLESSMTTGQTCDIVRGPAAVSSNFDLQAGDKVNFDWKAQGGQDWFDAYGYLVNQSDGTQIELLDTEGDRSNKPWETATVTIPSGGSGTYKFVFVNGTWDATCGQAAGGTLYIDNIRIVGNRVTDTMVQGIARLVTYRSSNTTTLLSGTKTVTLTAVPSDFGVGGVTSDTTDITINITGIQPPNISYTPSTLNAQPNTAITNLSPTNSGGASTSWSISPSLPAGLSFNTSTGVISGTPTAESPTTSYTITATNAAGSSTATIQLAVQNSRIVLPSSLLTFATSGADNNSFPQSEIKGTTVKLWKNVLTRAGYTFTGWNTKADGTGTSYADQASFNFDADFITLYAQWSLIKSTPTITWANPAYITTATPLSATQLNATASVPGTCAYTPALGATLPAGKPTLTCLFTPTDTTKYSTISKSVEIEVLAVPTLTWANPAAIKSGTALSATQLNATASAAGSFNYQPSLGAVLKPGKQTLKVTFTPTDTRLSPITKEVTIEITPALNPAAEAITTVSGGSNSGAITQTTTDATVVIKTLGVGLEKATATANQLTVFAKSDYSGKTTVVITVNDEARSVDLTVPVTVNPAAVAQGSFTITSASSSTATWQAASGAKSYRLSLDGKEICTSSTTSCQIPALTGPASKVVVKSLGADDTSSADKALAYEKPATPIEITSVNFATAKSTLTKSARNKLNAFASQVSALGLSTLVIQGHTDSVGGIDNQALSNARAQAAARYLRSKLANVNITVKGFGPNDPIADNSSDEGRAQNRRAGVYIGG